MTCVICGGSGGGPDPASWCRSCHGTGSVPDLPTDPTADEWAIVELLGHRRLAGRLSEVERFGCKMGRLDIPVGDGFVTHFFGGQSVYCISPVTERVARDAAEKTHHEPVSPWDYPKQLAAPVESRPTLDHDAGDDDSDLGPDDPDLPRW